jgi:DNA-binding MarR family transcriptional regulator
MSDIDVVLGSLPRIQAACRTRETRDVQAGTSLTSHQLGVLSHLDSVDPTMVTELAEYLGVTASTMSLNLKRLEAGGVITRERDAEDRRVMNVLLTPLGERVRDEATLLDPFRVAGMLRELQAEDRVKAVQGLVLLAEAADRLVGRGRAYVEALNADEA